MLNLLQKFLILILLVSGIAHAQTNTNSPPSELPASLGQAGKAPVAYALGQLIPATYKVAIKTSVPQDTILTWNASPNWLSVLSDAVSQAKLQMTINKDEKKITVFKEGRLPLAATDSSKVQTWKIEASDLTLANVFDRWAKAEGRQVRWDADKNILVEAPDVIKGSFEQAIATVLSSPGVESSYPLEVCFYTNTPPLARITRRGEQECK